jgi:hypothetical protein
MVTVSSLQDDNTSMENIHDTNKLMNTPIAFKNAVERKLLQSITPSMPSVTNFSKVASVVVPDLNPMALFQRARIGVPKIWLVI